MRHLTVAFVLSAALTLGAIRSVCAEPLADGITAADAGDYATALRLWRPLAESGNADAESYLGRLYLNGWGVPKDYAQAADWYRKAAEQGNEAAENNLGTLYFHGRGVGQDYVEAVMWFRKAADQGALEAFENLGDAYADGLGVPQDYSLAESWYRRAAESGYEPAQRALDALKQRLGGAQ